MTEEEAKAWLGNNFDVSRETSEKLEAFIAFLREEAAHQNLISAATLDHIWARHIVDSAQLLLHAPTKGRWIDLGSGAGFPGLIIAMLSPFRVTLVESRAKRIDYLHRAVERFRLEEKTTIAGTSVERLQTAPYSVISARAFAPLPRLLELSARFSTAKTRWLLPKGRNAVKELHEAHGRWNLDFTVEPSVTDEEAGILVGSLVGERMQRPMQSQSGRVQSGKGQSMKGKWTR
jgi:16S rRNA (guanine527-N7)-methyltransferase